MPSVGSGSGHGASIQHTNQSSIFPLQGLTLELGVGLPARFYLGGVFFGSLSDPPSHVWIGGHLVGPTQASVVAGGLLLGRHFGEGRLQARAEVLVGGVTEQLTDGTYDSHGALSGNTFKADGGHGLLEPRAGVDFYFAPQWVISATVGAPLERPFLPSVSVNLVWHVLPFSL
jgi:hypothetical protein